MGRPRRKDLRGSILGGGAGALVAGWPGFMAGVLLGTNWDSEEPIPLEESIRFLLQQDGYDGAGAYIERLNPFRLKILYHDSEGAYMEIVARAQKRTKEEWDREAIEDELYESFKKELKRRAGGNLP